MNKYQRWYDAIMRRAQKRVARFGHYYERHHVVPLAFGSNDKTVVQLTYREHFLAHWLLTKFTVGKQRRKMWNALAAMRRQSKGQQRIVAGWQYALAKKAIHRALVGGKMSAEHRRKTSLSLLGNQRAKGNNKPKSPEHRAKLAEICRANGRTEENVSRMIQHNKEFNWIRGKKQSAEHVAKRRAAFLATMERRKVIMENKNAIP